MLGKGVLGPIVPGMIPFASLLSAFSVFLQEYNGDISGEFWGPVTI